MTLDKYIFDPRVIKMIHETHEFITKNNLKFSDITDEEGNQYVDLVQEGGGVLGIGLIGYTYALEQFKIRFYSHGGTSAGSINATLLAAVGEPAKEKSTTILKILESVDLMKFVDGGNDAKKIVKKISEGASKSQIILTALNQLDDFLIHKQKGINKGDEFYNWVSNQLSEAKIYNIKDLEERMNSFDKLFYKENIYKPNKAKLAIVASDITTQTKAVFPKMSKLYFKQPDEVNPAFFVRASMSIPIFFEPLTLEGIPNDKATILDWQNNIETAYFGNIPSKITFVDGGILSNFPIDVFHVSNREPTRPTFGVKLGFDRINAKSNNSLIDVILNSFSAARQLRDFEVIAKSQDYVNLIASIDDEGINWLNFKLPEDKKVLLFARGVEAACKFLKNFNWIEYKNMRRNSIKVIDNDLFESNQLNYVNNFIRKLK